MQRRKAFVPCLQPGPKHPVTMGSWPYTSQACWGAGCRLLGQAPAEIPTGSGQGWGDPGGQLTSRGVSPSIGCVLGAAGAGLGR